MHETCVCVFKTNFESQMSRRITNLASRNVVGYVPTHWKLKCAAIFHFSKLFFVVSVPHFLGCYFLLFRLKKLYKKPP